MKSLALLLFLLVSPLARAADWPDGKGMEVVPSVDLGRYLGTWYEIASIPQRFTKGCTATKATYSMRPDGDIRVVNECRKGSPTGELSVAEGKAWVVDKTTNARLKVSFFWPFSGDYWIIELGSDYEYAVVGHPNREYFWLLSRTRQVDEALYQGILGRMAALGYDTNQILRTQQ